MVVRYDLPGKRGSGYVSSGGRGDGGQGDGGNCSGGSVEAVVTKKRRQANLKHITKFARPTAVGVSDLICPWERKERYICDLVAWLGHPCEDSDSLACLRVSMIYQDLP